MSNIRFATALTFLVLGSSLINALYTEKDEVIILTEENFKNEVLDNPGLWIVEFYASWCGHCKRLAPEYIKAAEILKGFVKLGAVDGTTNKQLMNDYEIKGFPTVKIFGSDKSAPQNYQSARNTNAIVESALVEIRNIVNVKEDQSMKSILEKIEETKKKQSGKKIAKLDQSPSKVYELSDSNFEGVFEGAYPWLVIFYAPGCQDCNKFIPEMAGAAYALDGKVKLGSLECAINKVKATEYKIRDYPTIKLFMTNGEIENYEGERTTNSIVSYVLGKLNKEGAADTHPPEDL